MKLLGKDVDVFEMEMTGPYRKFIFAEKIDPREYIALDVEIYQSSNELDVDTMREKRRISGTVHPLYPLGYESKFLYKEKTLPSEFQRALIFLALTEDERFKAFFGV